jgi:hypothetical protein
MVFYPQEKRSDQQGARSGDQRQYHPTTFAEIACMPTGYATIQEEMTARRRSDKEKGTRVRDIQYRTKCMRRDAMQTSNDAQNVKKKKPDLGNQ